MRPIGLRAQDGDVTAARRSPPVLRLLTFTTLYPNPVQPHLGVFVENRLRHLLASGEATSTVLAPVPWFPGRTPPRAAVPPVTERHGLVVHHPRFLALPGLGMATNPHTLYRAARHAVRQLMADGLEFDAIDAHYLFPDGVAAAWLAQELGKPVALTARGSDINTFPQYRRPRALILGAIAAADAVIAVSAGLKERLVALGVPAGKVTVLRNGVDLETFHPVIDRQALRQELGVPSGPLLLTVGNLVPLKGHARIIEALPELPACTLLIAGAGPEGPALQALARAREVAPRVRLLGAMPHHALPRLYAAADALLLASEREGWPNVVLEAMACGTPVIATPVFGVGEMLTVPAAGLILADGGPATIAAGVKRLLAAPPARDATRAHAEQFSWDATTAGQLALFRRMLERT
jgi:glycosyltransferase involved in cell wall biosynthesis